MFYLYQGNRLEAHVQRLSEILSSPLDNVFTSEIIVVPHHGLAHWLSLQLADKQTICANVKFILPAAFLWDVLRGCLQDLPLISTYDAEILQWRIFELLTGGQLQEEYPELALYLRDHQEDKLYDLSRSLAANYDQYLIYRPDWIAQWETSADSQWQARLWRALVQSSTDQHWVKIYNDFAALLVKQTKNLPKLPARVTFFAIPTLSPAYFDLVHKLSEHLNIHFFWLNPSSQYWGDILSERERARSKWPAYSESGNTLLASLGKQGRDFLDLLYSYPMHEDAAELFEASQETHLLGSLQNSILYLGEPRNVMNQGALVAHDDVSLQIHSCHSPMRELEVLYHQILYLLDRDPQLTASDILVILPTNDDYTAYIDAVFGYVKDQPYLPYNLVNLSLPTDSALAEHFWQLLDGCRGRCAAETMIDLLSFPAVLAAFDITMKDVHLIRSWLQQVNLCWGVDQQHLDDLALPIPATHTWRTGLDRLLLGYAMEVDDSNCFLGLAPGPSVEADSATLLGCFASFCEALFEIHNTLKIAHSIPSWCLWFRRWLTRLYVPTEEQQWQYERLLDVLNDTEQRVELIQFSQPVSFKTIERYLRERLRTMSIPRPKANGGITFSTFTQMRSVPHRVICLLGMNEGQFPTPEHRPSFDLLASDIRRGDRSLRADDRAMFLEAILSARDCLYISFVGQDQRTANELLPSVIVSELIDYLDNNYLTHELLQVSQQIIVKHPLQAFSRRYFCGDTRLVSYHGKVAAALNAKQKPRPATAFMTAFQSKDGVIETSVTVDEFVKFFRHPCQYFTQKNLGIYLQEYDEALATYEPFTITGRMAWGINDQILASVSRHENCEAQYQFLQAAGRLPHGQFGKASFMKELELVENLSRRIQVFFDEHAIELGQPRDCQINFQCEDLTITGTLTNVFHTRYFKIQSGRLSPRLILATWIYHLLLCCEYSTAAQSSLVVGNDEFWFMQVVEQPNLVLEQLCKLFRFGCKQPLPFFPKTSFEFVSALQKDSHSALQKANKVWLGNEDFPGEYHDPYYQLIFRGQAALNEDFERISRDILVPLYTARLPV